MGFKKYISSIVFFVLTIILVFITILLCKSNIINFVFIGLLSSITIYISIKYLGRAFEISEELKKTTKFITLSKNGEREFNINFEDIKFEDSELKGYYRLYCDEVNRLKKQNSSGLCDIEDYITLSMINKKINKGICEAVGGFSTGIGILGTFIGLIIGLREFNLGGDYDTVQQSIMVLINGIKTAFLTSIYGVIFSIVFSMIYRTIYHDTCSALETFWEAFHIIIPNSTNEINGIIEEQLKLTTSCLNSQITLIKESHIHEENIIKNQDTQIELIKNDIIERQNELISLIKENIIENQNEQISVIREGINALSINITEFQKNQIEIFENNIEKLMFSTTNTFKSYLSDFESHTFGTLSNQTELIRNCIDEFKINTANVFSSQSDLLGKNIDKFMTNAIDSQINQLKMLVKSYLTMMNEEVLGGQLDELRSVLNEINITESERFNKIENVVKVITDRETELSENTIKVKEFSETIVEYLKLINVYQNSVISSHREIVSQSDELMKKAEYSIQLNQESILTAGKMENAMVDFTDNMNLKFIEMQKNSETFEKIIQNQIIQMKDTCNAALESVSNMSKESSDLVSEMKKNNIVLETFAKNQTAYIEKIKSENDKTLVIVEKISETIQKANEQMKQSDIFNGVLKKYMDDIYSYQDNMTLAYQRITKQCEVLLERANSSTVINQESLETAAKIKDTIDALNIQLNKLEKQSEEQTEKNAEVYQKTLDVLKTEKQAVINEIQEIDKLHNEQIDYLEKLYSDTNNATVALKNVSDSVSSTSLQMYQNYNSLVSIIEKHLVDTFGEFDKITASVASNFLSLLEQIKDETERMPKINQEMCSKQDKLLEDWKIMLKNMNNVSNKVMEITIKQEEVHNNETQTKDTW